MKIAIIGSGISGLTSAYYLHQNHQIKIFEANNYIGGHTNTHHIIRNNKDYFVDTGFIVFNKKTYPLFIKLLEEIGVKYNKTSMSFSVSCQKSGLEYNGTNLDSLFADRLNLLRPSFYLFIKGILDFNKKARDFLKNPSDISLKQFFDELQIRDAVLKNYLVPMVAAVWSTDPNDVMNLPAKFILSFFDNHGFLEIDQRPQWYVIDGGSHSYVKKLIKGFEQNIFLNTPVQSIKRENNQVVIQSAQGEEIFDAVILATHSDISLKILNDASKLEKDILGAIPYTQNPTYLHQDRSFLPKRKKAWASWNYLLPKSKSNGATVTYNMNILQNIEEKELFNVTLNPTTSIQENSILKSLNYEHPLFTLEGMKAQARWHEISGKNNTYFCGAYWRNGFHEDGVFSAMRVVEQVEKNGK
jgi:predicted NAD/FAD-binding protein